ncbi:MAG: hypothetical protein M3Y42_06055 [Actinomycetota bacterium]|nr:hypothetical protein [Actinomycetota bacterium]MDQ2956508.1 hypothetical protein [Actinomycetota bacterium]
MVDVKVCLWNIQNYGQDSDKYNGTGTNNELRNRFIAAFVFQHDIDVLLIEEMQPGQDAALADLMAQLDALYPGNPDWAYSYCGCAILNDQVDVVTQAADLIDRTGARSECYAVVWRYHQPARYRMIDGIHQIDQATGGGAGIQSPLNISQLGRPTGEIPIKVGYTDFSAMGGFERAQFYPYEWDGHAYQLMDEWPKLNYPLTGNLQALRPSWAGSRRPAYVVLQLNDAHSSLCPVMGYHAPSKEVRASWGAFMAGLARELNVVDAVDAHHQPDITVDPVLADYGFVGGDFNYSVDTADWPDAYAFFTDGRGREYNTGSNQKTVPDPTAADNLRRTTVQIIGGVNHDVPIVSANPDDYLRHKIDLGFSRNIGAITAVRVNLMTEVYNNVGGAYNVPLTHTAALMDQLVANVAAPDQRMRPTGPQQRKRRRAEDGTVTWVWNDLITGSWGSTFTNWTAARNQYAGHNLLSARRSAEYIHIFVSDHLPLIATFTF